MGASSGSKSMFSARLTVAGTRLDKELCNGKVARCQ
jgi:hypothetical protein